MSKPTKTHIIGLCSDFSNEPASALFPKPKRVVNNYGSFNGNGSLVMAHPIAFFAMPNRYVIDEFLGAYCKATRSIERSTDWAYCDLHLDPTQRRSYEVGSLREPIKFGINPQQFNVFIIRCFELKPVEISVNAEGLFLGNRKKIGWSAPSLNIIPTPMMDIAIPLPLQTSNVSISLQVMVDGKRYPAHHASVLFNDNSNI